jgi:hypothetical protein
MAEEPDDDALTAADDALDVLRAELSVAPSPDFAARVRARVAQRPQPAMRWRWLVPAAAAALLLAGAIAWMRETRSGRAPSVAVESPAPPPTVAERPPAPSSTAEPARAARTTVARVAARRAPEPIVPPGEEMRIARYVASVQKWPFESETLPRSDPQEPLADPAPIEVAPLQTAPLVPDEGSLR